MLLIQLNEIILSVFIVCFIMHKYKDFTYTNKLTPTYEDADALVNIILILGILYLLDSVHPDEMFSKDILNRIIKLAKAIKKGWDNYEVPITPGEEGEE